MITIDEDYPSDPVMGEWFRNRVLRIHDRFNPNFGPHYDTTSGIRITVRDLILFSSIQRLKYSPMALPYTLAQANVRVIENAPEEEQRGLWQMFSSGLTGTFGIGSALNL